MKQHFLSLLLFFVATTTVFSTPEGKIRGIVIDATSKNPVEYADAILYEQGKETNAIQVNTKDDGSFEFSNVSSGNYILLIRLVGYDVLTIDDIVISTDGSDMNLGTLEMNQLAIGLSEVTVSAEKKQVIYKLDKQIISTSNNLLASGGTAIDILENTPSIRVNAEGDVTFRGSSGFTVYVNGKPSVLSGSQALEQIPASQIEDIEIITTPSAKYDTDGDVGMINIITKKSFGEGFNGVANLTGSTIGSWGGDILLNRQVGKNRIYFNGNVSRRNRESNFDQRKTTYVHDTTTTSHSNGPRTGINTSYYVKGGYEHNNSNTTFSADLQLGYSKNERIGDMDYEDIQTVGDLTTRQESYNSHDVYALDQNFATTTLNFDRKFNDEGHKLTASFYLKFDWGALEYYESNMYNLPITTFDDSRVDGSKAYETEHRWNLKGNLDYVLPYSSTGKIEAGYQYSWYNENGLQNDNGYSIKFWDKEDKEYKWNNDLYVDYYNYIRILHSLYFIWSEHVGNLEFQAGVRGENTHDILDIDMIDMSRNNDRFELFPSAHVSYSAPKDNIFTLAFSKRTNRPNIWNLEPYITYEDYYTAMVGNPDIKPEYTNAFELSYRKSFEKGNSLSVTAFHRDRTSKYERIRVAYKPGVTLDSLANVGNDKSSGLEFNSQIAVNKWWNLTLNGSAYYYSLSIGDTEKAKYGLKDAESYNYELTLQNSFTATPTTRIQFDANFIGPSITAQGSQDPYYYFDLSVRQQLFNKKINATLNFRDAFNTARYNSSANTIALESITKIRPKYPLITLTLSYAFNNYNIRESRSQVSHDLFEGTSF